MNTRQLGQVLGISKQRDWWNRQTYRRSTEEQAAANIQQSNQQKNVAIQRQAQYSSISESEIR